MVTQAKVNMLKTLKKASKENDAPIWAKVAEYIQKSRSNQKTVNLTRINKTTEDGNAIVITGKILGTGNISHKVSVSSVSISNSAAKKIIESGGEVLEFSEMIEKYPTGKGVKIIG
ncbi:MAG: 50S ribosomal protein L18e [Crenarchaeota archaeon]|nr:50S ribosomal protein L18e [Thermoproteota archaeon]MDA1125031.1 50S ribosomal protein L18e [Thermoproteota archaeon]